MKNLLPQIEGFEPLSKVTFQSQEERDLLLSYISKAKENKKIPIDRIWMGSYFSKELLDGKEASITVKYIDSQYGYGVFSSERLAKNSFVGEYLGIIQQKEPRELRDKKYCLRLTTWGGKKNFCIDAESKGNFTRFLNHSKEPNLNLQSVYLRGLSRMIFTTLKEVDQGEELTFDYGDLFWR